MENDKLREETEEETSSQEETGEEETSSQEETEEETSSQEETEEEEASSQEETEEETSESYFNPDFNRDQEHYEELISTSPDSFDTNDYSSYFENLQSLGIIITAFILGLGLSLAFALGFKKE